MKNINSKEASSKVMIFVDSNIFLRFYDSNQPTFKQLLKTLIQLKTQIFITQQIVDEVNRNKGQIFGQTFFTYIKQVSETFPNVQLPEHLDIGEDGKIKDWNNKRKKLKKENDALIKDLEKIFEETFYNISISSDEVSKELNKIFISSIQESDDEYNRAIKRKMIGNPPGKNNDSLGDQINWEQLMKKIYGVSTLFIISNDYDYFISSNNEVYLNPLLNKEIMEINPNLKILCFNKLSNGLQALDKYMENHSLNIPEPSVIEKIIVEEIENNIDYDKTIYHFSNHKLIDSLTRLNYMYRHAMLSKHELHQRLQELEINENIIRKILIQGYIDTYDFM